MSRERSRKRPIASINVVPYIDVMLVLLIIFMVTPPLLTQGVKGDLPQTESPAVDSDKSEPVVVTIQKNGAIFMTNGDHPERSIAPKELQRRVTILMQRKPATEVLVRGDHTVAYGAVVSVMALLQKSGVPSVGLVTDPTEK